MSLYSKNISVISTSLFFPQFWRNCSDFSVVLFDFTLFDRGYIKTARDIFSACSCLPVIILVNEKDAVFASNMLKIGAADIVVFPCSPSYLRAYIRRYAAKPGDIPSAAGISKARENCATVFETPSRNVHIPVADNGPLKTFIGISSLFTDLKKQLALAAENLLPVLLLGETGTGKSRAARVIHDLSKRKNGPFVEENMAAVHDNLAESELFGTRAGAYTGAVTRIGLFEKADGGTLFLDEIGCISLGMQAKLLHALETGEFRRVGDCQHKKADVRIICATNSPLNAWKESGRFRKDLYYRITGIEIYIPALKERTEDILPLAYAFLYNISRANDTVKNFSCKAEEKLLNHKWPGNVRELQNCIYRAFYTSSQQLIRAEDINFVL